MAFYQMDSSGMAKRYVRETGSEWVRSITARDAGHVIGLARITIVEVASALARKEREGDISRPDRDAALEVFLGDCQTQYQILEVSAVLVERAVQLVQAHPLLAYDAVQLAAALVVHQHLLAHRLPAPFFVSADDRLCTIAVTEGLRVENPNAHL